MPIFDHLIVLAQLILIARSAHLGLLVEEALASATAAAPVAAASAAATTTSRSLLLMVELEVLGAEGAEGLLVALVGVARLRSASATPATTSAPVAASAPSIEEAAGVLAALFTGAPPVEVGIVGVPERVRVLEAAASEAATASAAPSVATTAAPVAATSASVAASAPSGFGSWLQGGVGDAIEKVILVIFGFFLIGCCWSSFVQLVFVEVKIFLFFHFGSHGPIILFSSIVILIGGLFLLLNRLRLRFNDSGVLLGFLSLFFLWLLDYFERFHQFYSEFYATHNGVARRYFIFAVSSAFCPEVFNIFERHCFFDSIDFGEDSLVS